MRRVFLVGYYGVQNVGDEAIRAAIEHVAGQMDVDITWYSTRDASDRDPRALRLRDGRALRYLAACARADRVVLGGGGILKDEGIGMPAELWLTSVVARVFGTPVRLLAVGVGPFYTWFGKRLVAGIARMAEVRTVRDVYSGKALRDLGVNDVDVCADPIFSRLPHARNAGPRSPNPLALVSVRPWFHMDDHAANARRLRLRRAVGVAIGELLAAGYRVRCVNLYWPRDRDEAFAMLDQAGLLGNVDIDDAPMAWAGLVEACADADLVVAMRYHAIAAAALTTQPAVAIAYEPKVTSLAQALELPFVAVDDPQIEDNLRREIMTMIGSPGHGLASPERLEALRADALRAIERALS